MQNPALVTGALLMGAMLSVYLPMNAAVSRHLGSPITANITFFVVALVTSLLIFWIWGRSVTLRNIATVPWWLYLTGIFSAGMVLGTTHLIPLIGMRSFFVLTVSGQILTAIVLGHYGFLGMPQDPISVKKVIGGLFVIAGAVFSTL